MTKYTLGKEASHIKRYSRDNIRAVILHHARRSVGVTGKGAGLTLHITGEWEGGRVSRKGAWNT